MKRLYMGHRIKRQFWWVLIPAMWGMLLTKDQIAESRAYRDLLGLTPFKNVHVTYALVDGDSIVVQGDLVKVRCDKLVAIAYTRYNGHPVQVARFYVDDEPEGTPPNRPAMEDAQAFGPWRIVSRIPSPDRASLVTIHKCPEGTSSNVVFDIPFRGVQQK